MSIYPLFLLIVNNHMMHPMHSMHSPNICIFIYIYIYIYTCNWQCWTPSNLRPVADSFVTCIIARISQVLLQVDEHKSRQN